MPKACYIHIPFCSGKCRYCSFVSCNKLRYISDYIDALVKEISEYYDGEMLDTIYIGGGTPSLISEEHLGKILNLLCYNSTSELTIEINPENGELYYFELLRELGFNRISIGAQTFDDITLNTIGRRHNSNQIIDSIKNAKIAGFINISADLIYGLPNQSTDDVLKDLKILNKLSLPHISTYGLKIEGGTEWGNNPPNNIPDNDIQADMYELINNFLISNNYIRYEVSNFCKSGFESKHNLTYWNNSEYYGFGVSAHGYKDGIRYSNICSLEKYLNDPLKREYGRLLNEKEKLEEEIFLGFRKTEGIDESIIKSKFNVNFSEKYSSVLEKYSDYIVKTPKGYAFNMKGTMLSNEILPEFLDIY